MTRVFALLVAAAAALAIPSGACAQGFFDIRDIMGGGPNFRSPGGGSSPIARTTVSYASNYAPGTIVVNTAERRLYLVEALDHERVGEIQGAGLHVDQHLPGPGARRVDFLDGQVLDRSEFAADERLHVGLA